MPLKIDHKALENAREECSKKIENYEPVEGESICTETNYHLCLFYFVLNISKICSYKENSHCFESHDQRKFVVPSKLNEPLIRLLQDN